VYLHYNSGLHVSTNGRALSALLEQLVEAWPVPVEELVLLAHSLGGLVARSACICAEAEGCDWRKKLQKLVCLGAPHHGAPLERGGNWVDYLLEISSYTAPLARLGKIRSAGVTDMRFGFVLDENWQGRDRFPRDQAPISQPRLPAGVACYAAAATLATAATSPLPSDGLVPVDSALGRHANPALSLDFPESHQWIGYGMNHVDLLSSPEMYEVIAGWLSR
jgi:pimeloyl-ACP methyl ester carboxylesterase